jgi:hypothetical protein
LISSPVQALVVFDAHTDVDFVRAALPANTASQAIPLSHGVELSTTSQPTCSSSGRPTLRTGHST